MKTTTLKSTFIIYLLLIGNISCANHSDINEPVVEADDVNIPTANSLNTNTKSFTKRAVGNATANKTTTKDPNSDEDLLLQKRIKELENLIKNQQKLIELYKSGK